MRLRRRSSTRSMPVLRAASSISACVAPAPFVCVSDDQCVDGAQQGTCEPTGYCSFADDSCPSAKRYGVHASDAVSGNCVPACKSFNSQKQSLTPVEWAEYLEKLGKA